MSAKSLSELVSEHRNELTPTEALLASCVLKQEDHVAFHAAAKVAEWAGVSEATVVRFARRLGFKSYSTFQRHVQNMIREQMTTTTERLEANVQNDDWAAAAVRGVEQDIENLTSTLRQLDVAALGRMAHGIVQCRRLFVVGLRGSAGVAAYLGYALRHLRNDTYILSAHSDDIVDNLLGLTEEDVLLTVMFLRTPATTLAAMRMAKHQAAGTYLITDSLGTPGVALADEVLLAEAKSPSHLASYTSGMGVAHALTAAVGTISKKKSASRLAELEQLMEQEGTLVLKPRPRSSSKLSS